jgi:hypothetical protein
MKMKISQLLAFTLFISCGDSNPKTDPSSEAVATNASTSSNEKQQGGIVGEWEQQYTCFDKNGNYELEADEKKPSNTRLGFDWFKFNADGSCLRDKDIKFEGTYEIQEKGNTKKLVIQGGDNLHYTITGLTEQELILGSDGAFIVFKRIK